MEGREEKRGEEKLQLVKRESMRVLADWLGFALSRQ